MPAGQARQGPSLPRPSMPPDSPGLFMVIGLARFQTHMNGACVTARRLALRWRTGPVAGTDMPDIIRGVTHVLRWRRASLA